jgi:hypothetical protein
MRKESRNIDDIQTSYRGTAMDEAVVGILRR